MWSYAYELELGDGSSSRHLRLSNKNSVPSMDIIIFLQLLLCGFLYHFLSITTGNCHCFYTLPKLDNKTPHTYVTEHGDIKLLPTWVPYCYWLTFMLLEGSHSSQYWNHWSCTWWKATKPKERQATPVGLNVEDCQMEVRSQSWHLW